VGGKTGAGGDAVGTEALRVNPIGQRVGPHPPHGALHVIEGRRPGQLQGRRVDEAIVDAADDVSCLGQVPRGIDDTRVCTGAADERASMDRDHRRTRRVALGRAVDIEEEVLAASRAVGDPQVRRHGVVGTGPVGRPPGNGQHGGEGPSRQQRAPCTHDAPPSGKFPLRVRRAWSSQGLPVNEPKEAQEDQTHEHDHYGPEAGHALMHWLCQQHDTPQKRKWRRSSRSPRLQERFETGSGNQKVADAASTGGQSVSRGP
jgi:hypothetical protein